MNVLPFVFSILMVLALSIGAFFETHKTSHILAQNTLGKMNSLRMTKNQKEKDFFKYATKKSSSKKEQTDSNNIQSKNGGDPEHFRNSKLGNQSKLDIKNLLDKPDPFFEKALARYIENIYGHTDIYKNLLKQFAYPHELLVKELVTSLRKKAPEEQNLYHVMFSDSQLQTAWYQMLHGSTEFDIFNHSGIVPIETIITINRDENSSPICFKKAPYALLEAFLGKEIAAKIQHEEEKEGRTSPALKKEEFFKLFPKLSPEKIKYLQFNYRKAAKQAKARDEKSGISHTRGS